MAVAESHPPDTGLLELRRRAIDLNLAFSGMGPLLRRVRLLSLNAEVTSHRLGDHGASFSVVVKEVSAMATELRELVRETERVFWEMVNLVAKWIQAERRLRILQRSVDMIRLGEAEENEKQRRRKFEWRLEFDEGVEVEWRREMARLEKDNAERCMWGMILENRSMAADYLVELDNFARRLSGMVERINLVASRKSSFLAISAMVESARVGDEGADLRTVAENIRTLSNDITAVESEAMSQTSSLRFMSSKLAAMVLE